MTTMKPADMAELTALGAIWGGSFLFMRLGAGEFGPAALAAIRVAGAAALLLPLLFWHGSGPALRRHWRPIALIGLTNSAVPFLGFSYAALSLHAGLLAIFNASTPLFGAVIARLWLGERLTAARTFGLAIGFGGVLWLASDQASFKPGGTGWATLACLFSAVSYGLSASMAKRWLGGVAPLAVAGGSQVSAALVLALPAVYWWPTSPPSTAAWITAALLALLCTGVAYLMYFRLIAHAGASNALSVTFLVPAFAVLWGSLFLSESMTGRVLGGCAVILIGTALANGLFRGFPGRAAKAWRRARPT